jgi:selenocysteine-specific elongation factor
VAVNLAGIESSQLKRGHCLVVESDTETVDRLWAEVEVLPDATHPLEHGRRVLVMVGTAEPEGIAYPLQSDDIAPGQSGFCELRLEQPIKVRLRDRFVLRWPTPGVTVGGGVVLDVGGTRHSRRAPGLAERLEARRVGTLQAYRATELQKSGYASRPRFLLNGPFTKVEIDADLENAAKGGEVILSGEWVLESRWFEFSRQRLRGTLLDWHSAHPYSPGLNLAQWQEQAEMPSEPVGEIAALLTVDGTVARIGESYHLPDHVPRLPSQWASEAGRLWKAIETGGFQPPTRPDLETTSENARSILAFWISTGQLVALGDGVLFPRQTLDRIRDMITEKLQESGEITAAQLRDLLGTSRRYAVPILEALDREGTTRRIGDIRVLAKNE